MKFLDKVKIITDRPEYSNFGITKDMVGTIIEAEIRYNKFSVVFIDKNFNEEDIDLMIEIKDLELIKDHKTSDAKILESLPKNDPRWWCKVEDGYIINLLGEKKNKIPYDYNS